MLSSEVAQIVKEQAEYDEMVRQAKMEGLKLNTKKRNTKKKVDKDKVRAKRKQVKKSRKQNR